MFSTICFSQTPCENGMAGEYPCSNIDLLAHIPVSTLANNQGNPEGSDIWGWTDSTTGKEYAIAAMTNSTAFVDISDPINPVFLGRLDTNDGTSFWRDVKVYNNHAFIVADRVGSHGMQVFDLTKLRNITSPPVTFTADAIYNDDNLGGCHNIVINEDKAIAYLVGCLDPSNQRIFSGGPIFVDISNPTNPTKINHYANEGYSHDAQVVTYNGPDTEHAGKEIYIGSNETKISILDVTDKNNVIKLAEIDYSQLGYTHQGWFTDDHKYFILGDETDEQNHGINTRTLVFDVSNLDSPVLSSTYSASFSAIDHNGYVKGNEFYMANYRAGLRLFNISNISASTNSMEEIGYFDTYPANNGTAFNGAWSVYPYFESGNIIINDIERGLFIVKKGGVLSVDNQTIAENTVTLYPNPSKDNPKVKISNNNIINTIELFDLLGKKVYSKENINQSEFVIPTENIVRGIYFIKINKSTSKKLILK